MASGSGYDRSHFTELWDEVLAFLARLPRPRRSDRPVRAVGASGAAS
jgi:hypothetical protein